MDHNELSSMENNSIKLSKNLKILFAALIFCVSLGGTLYSNYKSSINIKSLTNFSYYSRFSLQLANMLSQGKSLIRTFERDGNIEHLRKFELTLKNTLADKAHIIFSDNIGDPKILESIHSLKNNLSSMLAVSNYDKLPTFYNYIDDLITELTRLESENWNKSLVEVKTMNVNNKLNRINIAILAIVLGVLLGLLVYMLYLKKNHEDVSTQAKLQFLHSSRFSSLGEFSASVAHEINNPLSIILWRITSLEKVLDFSTLDDRVVKIFHSIVEQAHRMDKVVKGIKLLSQDTDKTKPERFDIEETLVDFKEIAEHRLHTLGATINIECLISSNFSLFGRPAEIIQVLTNLLNNSISSIAQNDQKWIKLFVEENETDIFIKFTDSGALSVIKDPQRIFETFFTTKSVQGAGVGLSISRQTVEKVGGSLDLNMESQNVEFILRLPKIS